MRLMVLSRRRSESRDHWIRPPAGSRWRPVDPGAQGSCILLETVRSKDVSFWGGRSRRHGGSDLSAENSFLRYPTDPGWVFAYDALGVPLGPQ